jgi:predicted GIY-YIG superfamily endonuclease
VPFEYSLPHAFSIRSIQAHAPAASGVYGISNSREWIYIGQSDDIQGRLIEHLSELTLRQRGPTGFVYEMCEPHDRTVRQNRLIVEYEPFCNRPGIAKLD